MTNTSPQSTERTCSTARSPGLAARTRQAQGRGARAQLKGSGYCAFRKADGQNVLGGGRGQAVLPPNTLRTERMSRDPLGPGAWRPDSPEPRPSQRCGLAVDKPDAFDRPNLFSGLQT